MKSHPFHIIPSSEIAPQALTALVQSNRDFWNAYFPLTVQKNETLEKSVLFLKDIKSQESARLQYLFGVVHTQDNSLCGLVYIKELDWAKKQGELAYAIDKNHKRKGWMSAVVAEICDTAFTDLALQHLVIIAHRTNYASLKVATNNGFKWSKTLINSFTPPQGDPMNMELYTRSKS